MSYNFLFFLAGLQSIPKSVIEAAAIDGAGPARRFWSIIFPLLSPTTFFLLVVNIVYAFFDTFGVIHALTGGGPGKATETLIYKVYVDGVVNLDLGGSSAQSVILMVVRHRAHRRAVPLHRAEGPLLMVERKSRAAWLPHAILLAGVMVFAFPIYIALIGSTHDAATIGRGGLPLYPGAHGVENYSQAWTQGSGVRVKGTPVARMMANSFVMAVVIAVGKIAISLISAYAVVFFAFPLRMFFFWMIFITLMLPVEVRIIPTFKVVSDLRLINTFAGLTLPLIASATATLLFRQFFLTIPDELVEAAKIDGAGPLRFFRHILLPLSRTNIAALFVILFIYGWNQYLWPLLITTSSSMDTIVIGITKMIGTGDAQTDWNLIMATAMLAMLPPVAVILLMQRWFVKGLVETEK